MPDLKTFLAELAQEPFRFGELDCALALGRWWRAVHGVDPAASFVGTYKDASSCGDVLIRDRGLLRIAFEAFRKVGAQRTTDPKPGDVAIVRIGRLHFGAIQTPSGKWAIKWSDGGVMITGRCKLLMAWSI